MNALKSIGFVRPGLHAFTSITNNISARPVKIDNVELLVCIGGVQCNNAWVLRGNGSLGGVGELETLDLEVVGLVFGVVAAFAYEALGLGQVAGSGSDDPFDVVGFDVTAGWLGVARHEEERPVEAGALVSSDFVGERLRLEIMLVEKGHWVASSHTG